MELETLTVPRFDPKLGRYLDRFDLDIYALNTYAEQVGIAEVIEERAEQSGAPVEPITLNFHAGFCIEYVEGAIGVTEGVYHLTHKPVGSMPPADIDVFVGSSILLAREQERHDERETTAKEGVEASIREELVHAADPNLRKKEWIDDYLDYSRLELDPELCKKAMARTQLDNQLENRAAGILLGSAMAGVLVCREIFMHNVPYRDELCVPSGVAVFAVLGYAGLKLFWEKKHEEFEIINNEVMNSLYLSSTHEAHAKSQVEQFTLTQLISINVRSFAKKNISRVKI